MGYLRIFIVIFFLSCFGSAWADSQADWVTAIKKRNIEMVRSLVEHKVDVNQAADDGATALMVAAKFADIPLINRLIKAGARVNATNTRGGTTIMYAALNGDPATLQTLMSHGAEFDAVSNNGWTALMIASIKGHETITNMLLARGAYANRQDIYGWTPLMRAMNLNREGVVRILLQQGLTKKEINTRNEHGATALHYAAFAGKLDIVRMLLDHGADPASKDINGTTPSMVAGTEGHTQIASLLKQAQQ